MKEGGKIFFLESWLKKRNGKGVLDAGTILKKGMVVCI
jgi:hypothetical protein